MKNLHVREMIGRAREAWKRNWGENTWDERSVFLLCQVISKIEERDSDKRETFSPLLTYLSSLLKLKLGGRGGSDTKCYQ